MIFLNSMILWAGRLLQMEDEPRPDLTLNYIIIVVLLVIVAFLSVVVGKRRVRERDEEWDL
ncbi:MAG: hypothetical protein HYR56_30435 [Acidobacteria bacterium]|nr:hypothetical protein [Acidobacteriota bacterium]MBI3422948.1 hypothetical protein [Acidobacteriota bacterium]